MKQNQCKPQIIIVGSGLAGSIIARKIAEEKGRRVLVVERREHIGGNVYDVVDANGIRIQQYGPHIFHTNQKAAYELLCRFSKMIPYRLKCQVEIDGRMTPSPFNKKTIFSFFPEEKANMIYDAITREFSRNEICITELLDSKIECIREYAQFLFEKDYRLYTSKQWGIPPEEIDSSILRRVPVRVSEQDTYFNDLFEAIPKDGFTQMMRNILNHPNIQIELRKDATENITFDTRKGWIRYKEECLPLVYTGAIDQLFEYQYGTLPYRSLRFSYKYYDKKEYQQTAIVAHPAAKRYTRTTEYTKIPIQEVGGKTVIAYEYPIQCKPYKDEPYYPVLSEKSKEQYNQYLEYATQFKNLYLCGRLAEFKYYNMDQVILRALKIYQSIPL